MKLRAYLTEKKVMNVGKKRRKISKLLPGETRKNETKMNGKDNLRVDVYFAILDRIHAELQKRQSAYTTIEKRFNFLFSLAQLKPDEIEEKANELRSFYSEHIEDTFPIY